MKAPRTLWLTGNHVTEHAATAKTICVFAGSNIGFDHEFAQAAHDLGELLAVQGHRLVYGGAKVGLMGTVADAALQRGGTVIGVMPRFLIAKELAHPGLSELKITTSMHERKRLMAEMSDGFIALPGGLGTLEEFFEVLTWAQLSLHPKPCGLLNVSGYYSGLLEFLDRAVDRGFLSANNRSLLLTDSDGPRLLERMATHRPSVEAKWLGKLPSMAGQVT